MDDWDGYKMFNPYSSTKGDAITLRTPKGVEQVVALMTRGISNSNLGYTVTIKPDPKFGPAVRSYPSKPYQPLPSVLVMGDLDTNQEYEITITNDGGGDLEFTRLYVIQWVPTLRVADSRPSKSNLKVILPAVIVPVVVVGGALVGAFVWWRRRKAQRAAPKDVHMDKLLNES